MGAGYHRGTSNQEVKTPPEFMAAVEKVFGKIEFDLAASYKNTKAVRFWSEEDDSLSRPWPTEYLCWLNPPFSNIGPWAKKCLEESQRGCRILMLVPASVGSNWFRDYVDGNASVLFLNGRLTFVGSPTPYPKDLMLICWGIPGELPGWYSVWNWKKEL